MSLLGHWLAHPLTRGHDLDAPQTTLIRRQVIQQNRFLRQIYQEWYTHICQALPPGNGPVLELGSGAGFLSDYLQELITTEIFPCDGVRAIVDGHKLPFATNSLRAIVMTDVFHHLPDVSCFLEEANRCIRPGGKIIMIEPWVTTWSRVIYTHLHHEPFLPDRKQWNFSASGPLSSANGALPWIVFERDRNVFESRFAAWKIQNILPFMPFSYLLSGGVSMRPLMPGWAYRIARGLEHLLSPWNLRLAMFALIVLEKHRENF